MTDQEKISTILKTNKLGINSVYALESHCKVGTGSISKPLNNGDDLSLRTVKKIQDSLGISPNWWDKAEGDIYVNSTSEQEKESKNMIDAAIQAIAEGNTKEYTIIRTDLLQKHRLISVEQMAKDERMLDRLFDEYEKLLSRNEKLNARIMQLESQLLPMQKNE